MSFLRTGLIRSHTVVGAMLLLGACGGEDGGMTTPTGEEVGSVAVMPDSTNVDIGSTIQLQPVVTSTTGEPMSEPVTWLSLDEQVARVDESGLVTGARVGSTEVTATAGGVTGAAQIVVPMPLSGTAWFTDLSGNFIQTRKTVRSWRRWRLGTPQATWPSRRTEPVPLSPTPLRGASA